MAVAGGDGADADRTMRDEEVVIYGAGNENRTRNLSLGSSRDTFSPYPRSDFWVRDGCNSVKGMGIESC